MENLFYQTFWDIHLAIRFSTHMIRSHFCSIFIVLYVLFFLLQLDVILLLNLIRLPCFLLPFKPISSSFLAASYTVDIQHAIRRFPCGKPHFLPFF